MSDILEHETQNSKDAIQGLEDQKAHMYAQIAKCNTQIEQILEHLKLCNMINERSDPAKIRQLRILLDTMDLNSLSRDSSLERRQATLRKYFHLDSPIKAEDIELQDLSKPEEPKTFSETEV